MSTVLRIPLQLGFLAHTHTHAHIDRKREQDGKKKECMTVEGKKKEIQVQIERERERVGDKQTNGQWLCLCVIDRQMTCVCLESHLVS